MRGILAIGLMVTACDSQSKRVFTTSAVYTGDLGGLLEADAKCTEAAQTANLGGTFIALLSDTATDAIDRVDDVGPWELTDGHVAFNTRADIAAMPLVAIGVDEQGRTLGAGCSWTGSKVGATVAPELCTNWTVGNAGIVGRTGNITLSDMRWIEGFTDCGVKTCNVAQHLYCLEQ